jgi:alkanesulfonate monooxygenase SsuD/methylene tetrahydromethanopterin reductase-like flavin-dependent oxidoreductase (luciferase family)
LHVACRNRKEGLATKKGVVLPNVGLFADPRLLSQLGAEAEGAGWDGVFVWDSLAVPMEDARLRPACDAWIALGLIAAATSGVTIGTMITPLSRRRPWVVAQQTATLDQLSGGRLVLPVGLGALDDGAFSQVNEETDRVRRAQRLDESLEILEGVWRGEPFSFDGHHFRVDGLTISPGARQSPRIPVWVVALWPRRRSVARALRWDGMIPSMQRPDGSRSDPTPEDVQAIRQGIAEQVGAGFEVIVEIDTSAKTRAQAARVAAEYSDAGTTWWLEPTWQLMYQHPDDTGPLRARILEGPF